MCYRLLKLSIEPKIFPIWSSDEKVMALGSQEEESGKLFSKFCTTLKSPLSNFTMINSKCTNFVMMNSDCKNFTNTLKLL